MSFETFKSKVLSYTRPLGVRVRFNHANGRHYANLSDGGVIVGNTVAKSLDYRTFNGKLFRIPAAAM